MRRILGWIVPAFIVAFIAAAPVRAGGLGDFSFGASGGVITDGGVAVFPLTFDTPSLLIADLQLDILGLTHPRPADLNVLLVDPFGQLLQIMVGRGDQVPLDDPGVNLTFNDLATVALPTAPSVAIESGLYTTEESPGAFERYGNGGTDAWLLLVIDGAPDGTAGGDGAFSSFVLSGTIVPEPMTLALLGVGAIAVVRRRR